MGVNSLPKTVTRQRRDCDLNPGPSAPESSMLTTRLPSHVVVYRVREKFRLTLKRYIYDSFGSDKIVEIVTECTASMGA